MNKRVAVPGRVAYSGLGRLANEAKRVNIFRALLMSSRTSEDLTGRKSRPGPFRFPEFESVEKNRKEREKDSINVLNYSQ